MEVAGAILEPVGSILLKDIANIVKTHGRYLLKFRSQFDDLVQQVSLMQGYATDAEEFEGKLETVRITLNAVRELIYEADDLVIDCQIHAYQKEMREGPSCSFPSSRNFKFRYKTGKKLARINIRLQKMGQNINNYKVPVEGKPLDEGSSSSRARRWTSQVFDQSQVVGLDRDVEIIKKWILPDTETLNQVGIVGMGGLGKTTICQKIFDDQRVRLRFSVRIWLCISQSFNENDILKSILKNLRVDSGVSEGILTESVRRELSIHNYLIVFDDVWSLSGGWWERISLALPKRRGTSNCIIITSRNEDVVKGMRVHESRIHTPKVLEPDESWALFCKFAFMHSNGICSDPHIKELGEKIVKNCYGLPLAIKAVGGMLSVKKHHAEWKRIYDKLNGKLVRANDVQAKAVMASLKLSYDELPSSLKNCILCLSVFPEDSEMKVDQLVHWWVGEGFVHEDDIGSAVENGFDCVIELISRCLIEVVQKRDYDGRVYSFKVHDMVREMTIKVAKKEAFSSFDDRSVHIPTSASRRLGVTSDSMSFNDLKGNFKLRALLLMTNNPITFNRASAIYKLISLRVLDLSQLNLNNVSVADLWHWICSLKCLSYLNLEKVMGLRSIPDSIRKLLVLQTLILSECIKLTALLASIGNLLRLKLLDVGNCPGLKCLPQGLQRLENLEELYGFTVPSLSDTDGCQLGELRGLTKLRVLQVGLKKAV